MLKKLIITFSLGICSVATLYSQKLRETRARLLTTLSFHQFSGGVILLKGALDNYSDSLNFILDTGCGGISLDSATCNYLKLPLAPSEVTIKGIAGIRKVEFTYNHTLRLPGLKIDSLNFHVNNYELLTSVYGEHIDGVIGYSFFNRYIVKIDYDSNRIYVYAPGRMSRLRKGYRLKIAGNTIPVHQGIIKEKREMGARFYFDTGAGIYLLFSNKFVKDSLQFSAGKKMYNTQAEGLGGKAQMKLTILNSFKVGRFKFKKVPIYIFDDQYDVTGYPMLGGLTGNDLLRRFNVIFNYLKKEIYLFPNSHYREPLDYSYTGLGIYYIDGAVCVVDIMKDSPAEKAGLKTGDKIFSINSSLVHKDIQRCKTMLMQAGQKVKLLISRDQEMFEVVLEIKNILKD